MNQNIYTQREKFLKKKTLIIEEYPSNNINEPYYPINDRKIELHRKYKDFLKNKKNFTFGGCLVIMPIMIWI